MEAHVTKHSEVRRPTVYLVSPKQPSLGANYECVCRKCILWCETMDLVVTLRPALLRAEL